MEFASIHEDSLWVVELHNKFPSWGIIPNHRCGTWYVPPNLISSTCYFKSTDGHPESLQKQRMFGLRRLNLHLIQQSFLNNHKGLIIIDSTKNSQKTFPDSFTRTIPVWCSIINTMISKLKKEEQRSSITLEMHESISENEVAFVKSILPDMVSELEKILGLSNKDLEIKFITNTLQSCTKPFRLFWCNRENVADLQKYFNETLLESKDFYPIILANPSKEVSTEYYIKGAADDEEMWAGGITPYTFWENLEELINTKETLNLKNTIADMLNIYKEKQLHVQSFNLIPIINNYLFVNSPNSFYFTNKNSNLKLCSKNKIMIIDFSISPDKNISDIFPQETNQLYYNFPVGYHKKYRHSLENLLDNIFALISLPILEESFLVFWSMPDHNIALTVCLSVLIKYFDLNGKSFLLLFNPITCLFTFFFF